MDYNVHAFYIIYWLPAALCEHDGISSHFENVTYLHSVQDFFRLNTVNWMLQASQGIFFETFDLV